MDELRNRTSNPSELASYAFDAVWAAALALEKVRLDLTKFSYGDFGYVFMSQIRDNMNSLSFEGVSVSTQNAT